MAKVKPTIGELSGSVSATVFRRGGRSPSARTHAVASNSNTADQQAARARLARSAAMWQSLSDYQRDLWAAYAIAHPATDRLGSSRDRGGYALFLACNCRLAHIGLPFAAMPPTAAPPAVPDTTTVELSQSGHAHIALFGITLGAGIRFELLLGPPGTAGADTNLRRSRSMGFSTDDQMAPWGHDFRQTIQAGQTVNAWLRCVDLFGQAGVPLKYRCVVLPPTSYIPEF